MQLKFSDVELAFEYMSSSGPDMCSAVICKKTGRIFCASEMYDSDEDFPDEPTEDDFFFVPHKSDLDLGTHLVHRFANEVAPHLTAEIRDTFSRPGAYARFKQLLRRHGLLDGWYNFEADAERKAILEWCHDNGLQLSDAPPKAVQ